MQYWHINGQIWDSRDMPGLEVGFPVTGMLDYILGRDERYPISEFII